MHREGTVDKEYEQAGYYRHMHSRSTWRLRKAIEQSLKTATCLESLRLEIFARCAILRTAQWALDGRKKLPTIADFRGALEKYAMEMIEGARELRLAAFGLGEGHKPVIHCLNRSTSGLEEELVFSEAKKPQLVITSPPYPGVHVLYHRWQVDGRKESPAPFWIANKLDGDGSAYYTMGDRKAHELHTYFENLRNSLRSIAAVCSRETIVVQVMAFSEPSWHVSAGAIIPH